MLAKMQKQGKCKREEFPYKGHISDEEVTVQPEIPARTNIAIKLKNRFRHILILGYVSVYKEIVVAFVFQEAKFAFRLLPLRGFVCVNVFWGFIGMSVD